MAEAAIKKPKFDAFLWEGIDKQGKKVKGIMEAASVAYVNATLRRQGVNPVKVAKQRKIAFKFKKKITSKDISVFTRQLATMLMSGIPIAQSFDIVGKGHENPAMQEIILSIKQDIESGTALAPALGKYPLYFDALYCNLVQAGEQAGILDGILDKVATYKEKIEAIKGKIKSALFYPTAVIVVAFIITAVLLVFVIPQFESLFAGFGADLPAMTKMVINLSKAFQDWWWAIIGSIVGTVVFTRLLVQTFDKDAAQSRPRPAEISGDRRDRQEGHHRPVLTHAGNHVRRGRATRRGARFRRRRVGQPRLL